MMHTFLSAHRAELIARCRTKVAARSLPGTITRELEHGITVFLDQLIRTLQVEQSDEPLRSREVSGPTGGGKPALSEMGESAAAHGRELMLHGFTVEELVHDYGDLCQAITDLAFEKSAYLLIGAVSDQNAVAFLVPPPLTHEALWRRERTQRIVDDAVHLGGRAHRDGR